MPLKVRPFLDDGCKGLPLRIVELEPPFELFVLDQAVRPGRVEGQSPVAHRLQADRADPDALSAAGSVVDRG
ncbi:hypothetical protein SAMN04488125_13817 [Methylorubrum salsuginis]|uniref:Uncharacterized protein n=1 Tax=Methylorubrum salsuginis TaxID=414703 RepID=A0A1I4MGU5_9HYPH|nr:hypothetical protein SAMN04488125_13817 [Methylorubrum salsuginis]